ADEGNPLAHTYQAEAALARSIRVETDPVVLDYDRHRIALTPDDDADVVSLRVLDDVRERLLDDAVERGLDLGREPCSGQERLEADGDAGLLGEALGQPLERCDEAEVVECLRAELDREPAHVLQRRADELAHLRERGSHLRLAARLLPRPQAEQ